MEVLFGPLTPLSWTYLLCRSLHGPRTYFRASPALCGVLCDHGIVATYSGDSVVCKDSAGDEVLRGTRSAMTHGLWMVDLLAAQAVAVQRHAAATQLIPRAQKQLVAFYHAVMGSPALSTFEAAVTSDFLHFPGLTIEMIRKHPPNPTATAKGHLDQTHQGLRSTKPPPTAISPLDETDTDWHPLPPPTKPHRDKSAPTVIFTKLEELTHQTYSDKTGRFFETSTLGNQYMLIMYIEDGNYIHAVPQRSRDAAENLLAYKSCIEFARDHGITPAFERMDNETSKSLERYCREQRISLQYVAPGNHRSNKAERAIRTWKNHFIATLATTDPAFPIALAWDELMEHAELTLNLMRASGVTPLISAWHQLHGPFDFNRTPLAPPGIKVVVHEKPDKRGSWAVHGPEGFYVGPALKSYRCYRVFVPSTKAVRISDTLSWHPVSSLHLPGSSPYDDIVALLAQLQTTLLALADMPHQNFLGQQPLRTAVPSVVQGLQLLSEIFGSWPSAARPTEAEVQEQAPLVVAEHPAVPPLAVHFVEDQPVAPALPPQQQLPAVPLTTGTPERVTLSEAPLQPTVVVTATHTTAPPEAPAAVQRVPPTADAHPPRAARPAATTTTTTRSPSLDPRTLPTAGARRSARRTANRPARFCGQTAVHPSATPVEVTAGSRRRPRCRQSPPPSGTRRSSRWKTKVPASFCSAALLKHLTACTAVDLDPEGNPLTYASAKSGPNRDHWEQAEIEEFDRLVASGTITFIPWSELPAGRTAAYYNPQVKMKIKEGKLVYRIRGTIGGDRVDYPGNVTAWTAEMSTIKMLVNAAVSEDADFITADIKDFYLGTDLPRAEYMTITTKHLPAATQAKYNLAPLFNKRGAVLVRVDKGIYGLPQAGKLAQDKLIKHLATHGYHQCSNTPCLFKHESRPIMFTLVVDDFGIKVKGAEHAEHLLAALREIYTITVDYTGAKFVGITVKFDRAARTVTLSMPGYVDRALARFGVVRSSRATDSPSIYTPPVYGSRVQQIVTEDTSDPLSAAETKRLQQIVGVFLYYARAVDYTMLCAINKLGADQSKPTKAVMAAADRFLQYAATWPNAEVVYRASDMHLVVHSDASYLSESHARSRAGGIMFLCNHGEDGSGDTINGAIDCMSAILPSVAASAGESEYGALFMNAQSAEGARNTLADLGYPQAATPIISDNTFATGVANRSVKQRRSKALDMRYHWVRDRVDQGHFNVYWQAGSTNLADFFTKSHPVLHFKAVRHKYVSNPRGPGRDCARARRSSRRIRSAI